MEHAIQLYELLTKRDVKMADINQVLLMRVMDQDVVAFHKHAKKKKNPAILTEQAWSIEDLLYGFRGKCFLRGWRVVPSGQDSAILPARVANHSTEFSSSCTLNVASHIMKRIIH